MEGYPMRQWSIEIWLLDEQGNEVMPNVFEKATYNLHPSFEKNKQGTRARAHTQLAHGLLTARSLQEAAVPH
jgi:transcription initiation factor IIF auxiliary subunit